MKTVSIVVLSMAVSFAVGVKTAGDVQPIIGPTEAGSTLAGDFDRSGTLTLEDAIIALDLADGKRAPLPQELAADPNRDYIITRDDVEFILSALSEQED